MKYLLFSIGLVDRNSLLSAIFILYHSGSQSRHQPILFLGSSLKKFVWTPLNRHHRSVAEARCLALALKDRENWVFFIFAFIAASSTLIVSRWLFPVDLLIYCFTEGFLALKHSFDDFVFCPLLRLSLNTASCWRANKRNVEWIFRSNSFELEVFFIHELFHRWLNNVVTLDEETSINMIVISWASIIFLCGTMKLWSCILNTPLLL